MRFNSRGAVCAGLGQTWLDDDRVIGQKHFGGEDYRLCINGESVDARGCTAIAAGGGRFAAYLAGQGVYFAPGGTIFPHLALKHDLSGRGAAASDGTLALCLRTGHELVFWSGSDSVAELDEDTTDAICVLSKDRALWQRTNLTIGARGLPQPNVVSGPIGWPFVLTFGGELWIGYVSGERLVFHPFSEPIGYVLGEPSRTFYPHGVVLEGRAVVGWAQFADDSDVRMKTIDTTWPRTDLRQQPSLQSPIIVPPPPLPPDPPMIVPDRSALAITFLSPRLVRFGGDEEKTRAHTFDVVNELCVLLRKDDPRWGLLEKLGGAAVRERAADVLLYRLSDSEAQVVDVVSDAEGHDGLPAPAWQPKDIRSLGQWREPYPIGTTPEPSPPPPPVMVPPEPLPPPNWTAQLEQVQRDVIELSSDVAELREDLMAVSVSVDRLVERLGKLRVIGRTGSRYSHSHEIYLSVEDGQ